MTLFLAALHPFPQLNTLSFYLQSEVCKVMNFEETKHFLNRHCKVFIILQELFVIL